MFYGATAFLERYTVQVTPGELFWTLFNGVITDDNGKEYKQPNPWIKEEITTLLIFS